MKTLNLALSATTLLFTSSIYSKTITVTATKIEAPFEQTANSVSVISSEEIEESTAQSVPELLQNVAGLQTTSAGARGTSSSIFLRGANSGDLVVIVDGVKLNDPSKASKAPALEHLNIEDIDKIEVLKGSQSVLYGSDAIGGVIKITTKRGKRPGIHGKVGAKLGSGKHYQGHASANGKHEAFDYYLSATRLQEKPHSLYKDGAEKDQQKYLNLASNIGIEITDDLKVDLNLSYNDDEIELDGFDSMFNVEDDSDQVYRSKTLLAGAGANYLYLDGRAESKLKLNHANFKRETTDPTDTDQESKFDGSLLTADLFNNFIVNEENSVALGFEYEQEKDRSDTNDLSKNTTDTKSIYTLYQLKTGAPFATVGARYDGHSEFGGKFSYKLAPGYYFKSTKTKIFANYATNYKAPSLYQLYARPNASIFFDGGNKDLKPQEGYSYELGASQELGKDNQLTATYFYQKLNESIEYVNTTYQNEGEQKVRGIEAEFSSKIKNLTIDLNYTYMLTEDRNGDELKKRPKHQGFAKFSYHPNQKLSLSTDASFKGRRADIGGALGSYVIYNLGANYSPTKKIKLNAKAINITDKDYEETKGYSTYGRSYYVGGNWSF